MMVSKLMFVDNDDWSFNVLPNIQTVDTIMKLLNYKIIKTVQSKRSLIFARVVLSKHPRYLFLGFAGGGVLL